MGRRLIDLDAQLDALLVDLAHAGANGSDDDTVGAIIAAIDIVEDKQRRQAAYLARKDAQSDKIDALVRTGMSDEEAQATVTGKTMERVRKDNFIKQARKDGYQGAGFDALITDMHRDQVQHLLAQAEHDCYGYMSRTTPNDSGYMFWFCSDDTVTAHATDELLAWFEQHGRLTRAALRAHVLGESMHVASIGR